MADRIFAGLLLLVTLAYGFIAFTIIKAPFQYDPLGPESWSCCSPTQSFTSRLAL